MQKALEIEKDVRRCWELLYPAHLLNFNHGELGCFPVLYCKTSKNKFLAKKLQRPSSVHLGVLAGAAKITEDTKELLTRSFCEALWPLPRQSTATPGPGWGHRVASPVRGCALQALWAPLMKPLDSFTPDLTVLCKSPTKTPKAA